MAAAGEGMRASGLPHAIMRPSIIAAPGNAALRMMVDMLRFSPVIPVIGNGRYQLQPVTADDVAEAFARAKVIGNGRYQLQPVTADDVAEAFALAVERPDIAGTFDIAGPEALTYHQVLDALERALGVQRRRVSVPGSVVRFAAYAGMGIPNLNPITPDQLPMRPE